MKGNHFVLRAVLAGCLLFDMGQMRAQDSAGRPRSEGQTSGSVVKAETAKKEAAGAPSKLKFKPIFRKVLPNKATTLFSQIEWQADSSWSLPSYRLVATPRTSPCGW